MKKIIYRVLKLWLQYRIHIALGCASYLVAKSVLSFFIVKEVAQLFFLVLAAITGFLLALAIRLQVRLSKWFYKDFGKLSRHAGRHYMEQMDKGLYIYGFYIFGWFFFILDAIITALQNFTSLESSLQIIFVGAIPFMIKKSYSRYIDEELEFLESLQRGTN